MTSQLDEQTVEIPCESEPKCTDVTTQGLLAISSQLNDQAIELPSRAFGSSGARFKMRRVTPIRCEPAHVTGQPNHVGC